MKLLALIFLMALFAAGCSSKNRHADNPNYRHDSQTAQRAAESSDMAVKMREMNASMASDLRTSGTRHDERYLNMMLEHHRGAVMMSEVAIERTQRSEIRDISKDIIRTQNREIEQLLAWRKQWYGY